MVTSGPVGITSDKRWNKRHMGARSTRPLNAMLGGLDFILTRVHRHESPLGMVRFEIWNIAVAFVWRADWGTLGMEAGTQVKSLTASSFLRVRSWCPGVSLTVQQVGMLQFTENGQEWRHSMVKFSLDVLSWRFQWSVQVASWWLDIQFELRIHIWESSDWLVRNENA